MSGESILRSGRKVAIARWIVLVPGIVIAWFAVFISALLVLANVERSMCPPEFLGPDGCYGEWWWTKITQIGAVLGAGISAAVVVVIAACIAPSRKLVVTRSTFGGGACLALFFGLSSSFYLEAAAAVLAGALAVTVVDRRLRKLAVT